MLTFQVLKATLWAKPGHVFEPPLNVVKPFRLVWHFFIFAQSCVEAQLAVTITAVASHKAQMIQSLGALLPWSWALAAVLTVADGLTISTHVASSGVSGFAPVSAGSEVFWFVFACVCYSVALYSVLAQAPDPVVRKAVIRVLAYPLVWIPTSTPRVLDQAGLLQGGHSLCLWLPQAACGWTTALVYGLLTLRACRQRGEGMFGDTRPASFPVGFNLHVSVASASDDVSNLSDISTTSYELDAY